MAKPPSPGNLFFSDIGQQSAASAPKKSPEPSPGMTDSPEPSPWQSNAQKKKIYQVSELNQSVGQTLARSFPLVWLEGEVSNLSRPQSGHCYFSLKDDKAQIKCALFRHTALKTDANALQMGAKVLVRAKVGLYEPRGDYQLIVQSIEEAGIGELQRAYDLLLKKLQAEGLFAAERKRALPRNIRHVGLITSRTGAAVHDVISTIQRRNPGIGITLYPSMVQGEGAATTIREALSLAVEHGKADVILLVRGGGSLEDLWSFNDEALARVIADCPIPTVSGVGHEVDVTICDWVADLRAPTPTGAAELVATDSTVQRNTLATLGNMLVQRQQQRLNNARQQLTYLGQRLALAHPERKLEQHSQKLDDLNARLHLTTTRSLHRHEHQLKQLAERFSHLTPQKKLAHQQHRLQALSERTGVAVQREMQKYQQQSRILAAQLHTVSPLQTLARGYAIVQQEDRTVVNQTDQVTLGEPLTIRLSDGKLTTIVSAINKDG